MSVHITERLSCTEEIPPQARKKSPVSLHFISGGDGEWSDATRSMVPFASPFQRRLRLSFSRMGGAHLNSVAPRPMSRGVKYRQWGQVSTEIGNPSFFARRSKPSALAFDRCTICVRAINSRHMRTINAMASYSAAGGLENSHELCLVGSAF